MRTRGLTPQEAIAATYWCIWMSFPRQNRRSQHHILKYRQLKAEAETRWERAGTSCIALITNAMTALGIAELQASAKMSCRQSLHWYNSCPVCLPKWLDMYTVHG